MLISSTGSCRENVDQIKAHAFFNGIDWKKIEKKEITPLFKPPAIKHEEDTSNFCEKFTKMAIADEPSDSLSNHLTLESTYTNNMKKIIFVFIDILFLFSLVGWSFDNTSEATEPYIGGAKKRSALAVEDSDMMSKNRRMFR